MPLGLSLSCIIRTSVWLHKILILTIVSLTGSSKVLNSPSFSLVDRPGMFISPSNKDSSTCYLQNTRLLLYSIVMVSNLIILLSKYH